MNKEHRIWSLPVMWGNDAAACANAAIFSKLPFADQTDFLFPAMSNKLETVGHFAIEGAMNRRIGTEPIVSHDMFNEYEAKH